jgi:hypothetical protein
VLFIYHMIFPPYCQCTAILFNLYWNMSLPVEHCQRLCFPLAHTSVGMWSKVISSADKQLFLFRFLFSCWYGFKRCLVITVCVYGIGELASAAKQQCLLVLGSGGGRLLCI